MIRYFLTVFGILHLTLAMSQSLSVMSYNIRLDTEADGINRWANRTGKVVALIKKYYPDVFGVQEALHNQMGDLQAGLGEYSFVGVGRDDGQEKGEYSAIFFKKEKFKIIQQGTFWLSTTPQVAGSKSWDAAITRIVTWARFHDNASGAEFVLANTHFDHLGKVARENSAALIKGYFQGYMYGYGKNLPLIITGDFNSAPDELPYQTMIMGNDLALLDSRPATDHTGTFCGFEVNKMDCRTIDYIFHSQHWTTTQYHVIQDHDGKYYPSDHLPVLATFIRKSEK